MKRIEIVTLTLANLFGLKVGLIATLLLKGVTPRRYYEKRLAREDRFYTLITFLAVLGILVEFVLLIHSQEKARGEGING